MPRLELHVRCVDAASKRLLEIDGEQAMEVQTRSVVLSEHPRSGRAAPPPASSESAGAIPDRLVFVHRSSGFSMHALKVGRRDAGLDGTTRREARSNERRFLTARKAEHHVNNHQAR